MTATRCGIVTVLGVPNAGKSTLINQLAGAKVSMRLVPDQDPEDIAAKFTEYVKSLAPEGVRVTVVANG